MNSCYNIDASCCRYVVPFIFDLAFDKALALVDSLPMVAANASGSKLKWARVTIGQNKNESDLYEYIKNEIIADSSSETMEETKYGCSWLYRGSEDSTVKEGKHIFDFRYFPGTLVNNQYSTKAFDLYVRNVGMILYRNGLGFFWYELKIPEEKMTSDDVKLLQYRIRELNRDVSLWRKVNAEPDIGFVSEIIKTKSGQEIKKYLEPFSFGTWIAQELSFMPVRFVAERQSAYPRIMKKAIASLPKSILEIFGRDATLDSQPVTVPDKAVLFTYCAFKRSDASIDNNNKSSLAYHLANGYKDSYHCSDEVFNDMRRPFSDVIWYATQEGAAFLAWPQDDNRVFFNSVILGKIKVDYFTLFLKALFQSYSLLLYAARLKVGVHTGEDAITNKTTVDSITALYSEINTFLTKSMATSVSHVHHQSEFYNYLKKQLRIQEDVNSITAGLDSLYAIQREKSKKEENRRILAEQEERSNRDEQQKKRDDKFQAIMGLFALLSISSALIDCFDFIANFDPNGTWYEISVLTKVKMIVFFTLIGAVSVLAIMFSVRAIIDAFRKRKNK